MKCVGLTVLMVVTTINGWPTAEEDLEEPVDVLRDKNGPASSFRPENGGLQRIGQSDYGELEYYNDGNEYFDNPQFYAQNEAKSHRRQNSENIQNNRVASRSRELNAQQASYRSREPQNKDFGLHSFNEEYLHHGEGSAFRDSDSAIKSSLDLESAHRRAYNSKDAEIYQHAFVKSHVINGGSQVPHYIENKRTRPIIYYIQNPSGPASTFQRPKTFSNPLLRSSGKQNFENEKERVDYATETGNQNGAPVFQRPTYYLPIYLNVNDDNADKVKVIENAVNKDEDKVKVVEVANDSGNQDDGEKVKFVNNASNNEVNVVESSAGNPSIPGIDGIWNQGLHHSHLLRFYHQSQEPVFQKPKYYLPSGKFTNNPRYKDFHPSVVTKPNYGPFLDYPVHVRKGYIPHRIGGNVNVVENADNSQNIGKPINKDDDKVKVVETADNSENIPNVNDENPDKVKVVENAVNTNDQDKVKVVDLANDSGNQDDGEKVKFVNNNNTGDESNNGNNGVYVVESPANNPISQGIWNQGNDNSHLLRYTHQSNEPIYQKHYYLPHGKFVNNPRYRDYPTVANKPNFTPNIDYPVHVRGIPRVVNTDADDGAPGFMTSPSNVDKDSEYPDSVKNIYKSRPSYNGFSPYRTYGKNDDKNGPVISNSYYRNPPNFLPNQAVNRPTTIVGGPATGFQVPDISPIFADVIQLPDGTYIPSNGNNAPESESIVKPVEEKLPQEILPSVVNEDNLEKGVPSSVLPSVIEDSKLDQNPATPAAQNNRPVANEVPNVVEPTTILGDSPTVTGSQIPDISPTFVDVLVQPDGTLIRSQENNGASTNDSKAPVSKGSLENLIEQQLANTRHLPATKENHLKNNIVSSTRENDEENKEQGSSTNSLSPKSADEAPNDKNQQETSETESSNINDIKNKENTNKLTQRHQKGSKNTNTNDVHNVDKIEASEPNTETPLTKNNEPSKTNDNTKIIEDVKVNEDQKTDSKESDLSENVKSYNDKKHKSKHSKEKKSKKKHSKRNNVKKIETRINSDDKDNKNDENTTIEPTEAKEKSDKIYHPSEKNKEAQENETVSEDNDLLNGEDIKKDIEPIGGEEDNKDNKVKRKHGKRSKGEKSNTKRRHRKDQHLKKHKNNKNIDVTNKTDEEDTKTTKTYEDSSNNQQEKTVKRVDDTVASSNASNPKEDTTIDVKDKTEKDVGTPENSSVTSSDDKAEDSKNDEESVIKDTEKKNPSDVTGGENKGDENKVTSDDRSNTENNDDLKNSDKDTKSDSTKGSNANAKDLTQSQKIRKVTRYYKLHLPKRHTASKTQSTTEKEKSAEISKTSTRKSDKGESISNLPINSDSAKSDRTDLTETVDENETKTKSKKHHAHHHSKHHKEKKTKHVKKDGDTESRTDPKENNDVDNIDSKTNSDENETKTKSKKHHAHHHRKHHKEKKTKKDGDTKFNSDEEENQNRKSKKSKHSKHSHRKNKHNKHKIDENLNEHNDENGSKNKSVSENSKSGATEDANQSSNASESKLSKVHNIKNKIQTPSEKFETYEHTISSKFVTVENSKEGSVEVNNKDKKKSVYLE